MSPSPSASLDHRQGLSTCLSFPFLLFSLSGPPGEQSLLFSRFFFFFFLFFFFFFFFLFFFPFFFFFLTLSRSALPAGVSCISFPRTDSGFCTYHLVEWLTFNLLLNSQWITFPTQSCLVLYSFSASVQHSLIDRFVYITAKPTLTILLYNLFSL